MRSTAAPYTESRLTRSVANERVGFPVVEHPVFVKTSPKHSFSVIQNERFGLVFVKTGSIISGTGVLLGQKE